MRQFLTLPLRLGFVLLGVVFALTSSAAEKAAKEVKFSQKRGFYDQPIEVSLTCEEPGAQIRYTTNSSAPTEKLGVPYSAPLKIAGTTVLRAIAFKTGAKPSPVSTHTYLFATDIIRQSPDGLPPVGWPYRWGQNRVDYGMDQRVVNDPKYRDEIIKGLNSLPVFSVVMDLGDLFDEKRGIYANPGEHGKEVERPCSVEMIHADGRKGFQENAGIRIRGGFSRMPMNAKHSFRLFFRKQYGEGKLKFPVFGPGGATSFDGFDLRTAQNYSWSMGGDARAVFVRDQVNRDLQLALGQPAARGDFCHLVINGQYWGLYDTCERTEASFAAAYFGGVKEDYDVLKPRAGRAGFMGGRGGGGGVGGGSDMPFATDGNREAWRKLWETARAGLASPAAYQALLGNNPDGTRNPALPVLLDPVNLIDYMLVIIYGGNIDSPVSKFGGNNMPNNWFGSRSRKGTHGFRFFIWDAEHTFLDVDEDRTGPFSCGEQFEQSNPQYLFQQCLDNADFRQLVTDRVHKHFGPGGALSPEGVRRAFERRTKEIESAVVCESARWGDSGGGFGFGGPFGGGGQESGERPPRTRDADWRPEVKRILREFIPKRSQVVIEQLWGLGLWPDLKPPTLELRDGKVALGASKGSVHYTLDGTDPRLQGGARSPKALTYSIPIAIESKGFLKARTFWNGEWSALAETALPLL